MKNIILIIFCTLLVNITFSQSEKSDAEFLKIVKEYTLNEDGSIDFHYVKSIKLLSHFSFHRLYGETFIKYNTDFQKLKVNSSYTIMADGKKTITPSNAYNEVLPRFANNSPAYNNIREMVVTHTGLEVGAVINLDYTIVSSPGYYPALMGEEIISESAPVKEMIIKVRVPETSELYVNAFNTSVVPSITTVNGNKVYTWNFSSIPASSKESYQEKDHMSLPRVVFSTVDFQEAYRSFVAQDAFHYTTNQSMDNLVNEIIANENDQLKVVLKLQKIVSNDLNNLGVPLKYTGFKCRNPIETWNSNQGTLLEKTILLTALLHKVNIKAEPVVIIPNSLFNRDIGDLLEFNDFMVKVNLKKLGDIYLTPNKVDDQNQKFDLGNRTVVILDKNIPKPKVWTSKPTVGGIRMICELDLQNNDKLLGNISLEFKNSTNPYFKLYQDSAKVKSLISGIPAGSFKTSKIKKLSQEVSVTEFTVEKDNPTSNQEKYRTFILPKAKNGVDSWHMTLLTAERNAPVELPNLVDEKYEYAIVLNKDASMVSNNVFTIINNDIGAVTIHYEQKENEILITREISFKKKLINVSEYSKFKKIMDIWNNKHYRELIYKE